MRQMYRFLLISLTSLLLSYCFSLDFAFADSPDNNLSQNLQNYIASVQQYESAVQTVTLPPPADSTSNFWPILTAHFSLEADTNRPEVRQEISWFLSHPAVLHGMLNNSPRYIYYVYQQTEARHMPAEFALLPMVESGYDPFAYSSAGATGLWQMMPGTAASVGLDINWWYDARRDTVVSTQAALNFLASLHAMTHDWLLTAASYNVGSGAVLAAQQNNRQRHEAADFWDLQLPPETREYVPRLLALAAIIKNPSFYGVQLPSVPNRPYFAMINLSSQIDLAAASRFAGVSIDSIHRLNPGMLRWATNPSGIYSLLVPYDSGTVFASNLKNMAGTSHVSWQYHEIRARETLDNIAKNYHTTIALLKQVNGVTSEQLPANQGLLVPLYLNRTYGVPVATAITTIAADQTSGPVIANDSLKTLLGKIYSQSN